MGLPYVPRRIAITKLAALFCGVLALSLLFFAYSNQREHDRVRRAEYLACIKDQQTAANQKRVIIALLYVARAEFRERGEGHLPIAVRRAEEALANVPEFNCQQ